ncbi:MAG: carbohydrate kinase family protein [Anaerolineales bacterium]|nr:carbohydrate kinase family protein [Anaerolineales bacterium]
MAHLLVIGGASSDILHFAGQTAISAGGAGMYTAMAAHRCGVQVSLYAPRPSPIPDTLRPVADRLTTWQGPFVPPEELGHFDIAYQAGKTTYLKASLGAESSLTTEALPPDLSIYDCVHITPLLDAQRQLTFLQACRQRGAKRISVGTFLDVCVDKPDVVRVIMDQADFFFMNEHEAVGLFGSLEKAKTLPGKVLFVTLGNKGALVIQGDFVTRLHAVPAIELDSTGAGDTFCGATVAHILQGFHPVMAAHSAASLAAQMIEHVGPTALFWSDTPPGVPVDPRVVVNESQVQKVSQLIATLSEVTPFNFTGSDLPPVGHPTALDYFFTSTVQQFSFWTTKNNKYHQPLIAPINGVKLKGSSYLYQAYLRHLDGDPEFYTPARQAEESRSEMLNLFRSDDGTDPMPALELHLAQARGYGQDMLVLKLTPDEVVRQAQGSSKPLQTFFGLLDQIGGYKEDPLRKKSGLLALSLNQRPEVFLSFGKDKQVTPVIDYHVMRSCLRIGLVDVVDQELSKKLTDRQVLQPAEEWAVRYPSYIAIEKVVANSGKSMGAVDWFFFNSRKRCPEMTEPVCQRCQVDPVCAHRKDLFQPVLRTTFY